MSPARAKSNQGSEADRGNFSNEFRAVLACCRIDDAAPKSGQELLEGQLDWQRVLSLADFHGVTPQLHRSLNIRRRGTVPSEVRAELEARFKANAWKSLRLTGELFRVLDCLRSVGILAVPYKGPALAELLYGDVAMREYSDLDVLVHAADFARTKEALPLIGFTPSMELPPAQECAYVATGYEYTFDGTATKNMLEVQWNFVPRFFAVDFAMEKILSRCGSVSMSGRTFPSLRVEDLLLALCVHGAKHLWKRVCWVRDIAGVLEKLGLDWAYVDRESNRLGIRRIVGVSVELARQLLGSSAEVAARSSILIDPDVRRLCEEMLQAGLENEESDTESLAYFRWMLRLRERTGDRMRFLGRLAFTPSVGEWQVVNLPDSLFPLYRVIRVGRLAGRLAGLR
jgi:hypothetical protein